MTRVPIISVIIGAAVCVASASAAVPSVAWTTKDMKTAIRGVGYPKPHPATLACKGMSATSGKFMSFRCVATYRHHRVRRFYAAGRGWGGWLCAGRTLSGCTLLKHGFVTTAAAAQYGVSAAAQLAARGYVDNHYGVAYTVPYLPCTQASTSTQTFCYRWTNNTVLAVSVSMKAVRGGYVTTATSAVQ